MMQCTGNETRMERWMKFLPKLAVNTGGLGNRADKRGGGGDMSLDACCPL